MEVGLIIDTSDYVTSLVACCNKHLSLAHSHKLNELFNMLFMIEQISNLHRIFLYFRSTRKVEIPMLVLVLGLWGMSRGSHKKYR